MIWCCKKKGHTEEYCWNKKGGKGSGKGDKGGKGKGKGKGKKGKGKGKGKKGKKGIHMVEGDGAGGEQVRKAGRDLGRVVGRCLGRLVWPVGWLGRVLGPARLERVPRVDGGREVEQEGASRRCNSHRRLPRSRWSGTVMSAGGD